MNFLEESLQDRVGVPPTLHTNVALRSQVEFQRENANQGSTRRSIDGALVPGRIPHPDLDRALDLDLQEEDLRKKVVNTVDGSIHPSPTHVLTNQSLRNLPENVDRSHQKKFQLRQIYPKLKREK